MIGCIYFDTNGDVMALYSDDVDLTEIGPVTCAGDASRVVFNLETQLWDVRLSDTSKSIASFKLRGEAIQWERDNLSPGGPYWDSVLKMLEANTV